MKLILYSFQHLFACYNVNQSMRLLLLFILAPLFGWTQVPDSIDVDKINKQDSVFVDRSAAGLAAIDSILTQQEKPSRRIVKKFFEDYPNPNKALLVGLVIPGGGQMYNGAFWKVPLVYGAYGTVITLIAKNTKDYNFYKDQYFIWAQNPDLSDDELELLLDPSILPPLGFSAPGQVKTVRDELQRRKEYSWFALFGVTLLSVADAFVDCHLKDFDVSDDISFEFKPTLLSTPGWGNSAGVGFSIPIR